MTTTDTHRTLAEIVITQPSAVRVFDVAGLDYCCHGDVPLDEACAAAGIDTADIQRRLQTSSISAERAADDGWTGMTPSQLVRHIVETHHRYLWDELPALEALAGKVVAAHGERHPELAEVLELVRRLRAELEPHMLKEERVLFPAIDQLFAGGSHDFPFGSIGNPIQVMIAEHDRAGDLLAALRIRTDEFLVPSDGCASYRALYRRLSAVEHDTHVHVHKENHVLFPAAVAAEQATHAV